MEAALSGMGQSLSRGGVEWSQVGWTGEALPPSLTAEPRVCGVLRGEKIGDMDFERWGGGITGQDHRRAITDSGAPITLIARDFNSVNLPLTLRHTVNPLPGIRHHTDR